MSYIQAKNLSVGYEGEAVGEQINFTVDPGDYLCIVGENGSGKSTLMKTILNLQKPLGGEIVIGDGLKKNEIGYLPQQTPVQKDFPASVEEIVLSGCQARCGLRPFYNKEDKALARENMEKLGIDSLKRRCYRDLSGGRENIHQKITECQRPHGNHRNRRIPFDFRILSGPKQQNCTYHRNRKD